MLSIISLFEVDEETNPRGEIRPRFFRRLLRGGRFGRKDGSGKGIGQPGGLRRNRNTEPCVDEISGGGQGLGQNRK